MKIKIVLVPFLKEMLWELKNRQLEVTLAPNKNNDGCIRVAKRSNPEWYRNLCKLYPKPTYKECSYTGVKRKRRERKHPQTNLNKSRVMVALKNLIYQLESDSVYAKYLIQVASEKMEQRSLPPDEVDWRQEIYG